MSTKERIIACVNQKGGVGKTTSVVNIATGLARRKKKVLVIDLDPQGHLTQSFGLEGADIENKTIHNLLLDEIFPKAAIQSKYGVDIIPSDLSLSGADLELGAVAGREFLLKEILANKEIKGKYDYILIDCSPSLGILTINGLNASKEIFIPVQAEFLALKGISLLLQTVETIQKRLNPELVITGVIATMFDARKKLNTEVLETLEKYFGEKVFKTKIRSNVKLGEAPSFGQPIFEYAGDSNGAADYKALVSEIIKMEKTNEQKTRKRSA